jgi:GNAT superfamily N-acetyltransferase
MLTTLRVALFRELGHDVSPERQATFERATLTAFANGLKRSDCLGWLAESGNRDAIGSTVLLVFPRLPSPESHSSTEGYLLSVYTVPTWRRQGVATALSQAAVAKARELGLARIRLHATSDGQPVYGAIGFLLRDNEMELCL